MVARITLPQAINLDLQGNDLLNVTNLVFLWRDSTDLRSTYDTAGTLVYTDNAGAYQQWRRNSTAFADDAAASIAPYATGGDMYWEEIEVTGGNSLFEGWTVSNTAGSERGFVMWDPADGRSEWRPGNLYAPGDSFFTGDNPLLYPEVDADGNFINQMRVYRVASAYLAPNIFDNDFVLNGTLVDTTMTTPFNPTNLRWTDALDHSIPDFSHGHTYAIGDVIAYKFAAGSIVNIPGGLQIPPVATTSILRYTGAETGGTSPAEEPLIQDPMVTGTDRSSRDWAIETGSIATYNGATSFSFGAYAVHERQLFRALTDNIRPRGGTLPVPEIGANWELESDAAILHWRPNTQFYAGNVVFQTGLGGAGIYTVDADIMTGANFDTCLLYTSPSPRDS